MNHVPYKGSAPAATALLSGEVMAGLDAPQSTLPHLRSGRLRALAMGSTQRIAIAPEIPTFAEAGLPGYTASAWFGLFLPAGTPKAIVDATHREGVRALQLPKAVLLEGPPGLGKTASVQALARATDWSQAPHVDAWPIP